MNPRIDAASAASHAALIRVESAQNLLAQVRRHPLNPAGVFAHVGQVRADLAAAIRDLTAAHDGLAVEWPTTADYLEGAP